VKSGKGNSKYGCGDRAAREKTMNIVEIAAAVAAAAASVSDVSTTTQEASRTASIDRSGADLEVDQSIRGDNELGSNR
jgi:hypothetical protein